MNNRTMATVYVDRDSISLKTRSRNGCSPQQFIILKKELQRLEEKKYLIAKDIHSYAELRLCDAVDGVKVLEFSFTWLKDAGRDSVSGYTVPFPVSWTVKMKKKQKETQDILSYHSQAAGCSDKARAKASGGRQPIEECGRTGL